MGDAYVYGVMKSELVEIMAKQKDLDGNGPWKEEFFLARLILNFVTLALNTQNCRCKVGVSIMIFDFWRAN